ncbi:MAG: fibronectin type III domain-containing protein [Oscillospiraceae bacterium]
MRSNRIISSVLAAALAVSAFTFVPTASDSGYGLAITASAAGTKGLKINNDGGVTGYTGTSTDVVIPSTVKYIEKEAFKKNQNIKSVTFEGDILSINEYAFYDCDSLETVTFKGNITSGDGKGGIQKSAFEFCSGLKEVNFTNKDAVVDQIGKYAFDLCSSLESITIPSGTAYINFKAFANCSELETVIFEGGVTNGEGSGGIDEKAFPECKKLKEVRFRKSDAVVDCIGEKAFQNCFALKKINLPSGTVCIKEGAFSNCKVLTSVTVPADTKLEGKGVFGYMNGHDNHYVASVFAVNQYEFNDDYGYFLADGKTPIYILVSGSVVRGPKKITQKKITLDVTKGSPAEKWAIENNVAYICSNDPSAPRNIKVAAKTADSITLKWDEAEGADAYAVFIYNDSTKKYEKYKSLTAAQCKVKGLKKGTRYKFIIKSLKKNGDKYKVLASSKAVAASTSN